LEETPRDNLVSSSASVASISIPIEIILENGQKLQFHCSHGPFVTAPTRKVKQAQW